MTGEQVHGGLFRKHQWVRRAAVLGRLPACRATCHTRKETCLCRRPTVGRSLFWTLQGEESWTHPGRGFRETWPSGD